MFVDIWTDIVIDRPRALVSSYAADPDNAPSWYVNIKSVEWITPRPLRVGTQLGFVARFLGRRLVYVYEVLTLVPGEELRMKTAQGPFPMETRYTWESTAAGGTHMTLQNVGSPSGFSKMLAPFMSRAMRNANRKDVKRLKQILEGSA